MTLAAHAMAVVVGIEHYEAGERWRLDGPALDACRFAQWLSRRGVPADRITVLVSPLPENTEDIAQKLRGYRLLPADHANIRNIFTQYLPSKTSELLFIYWGGHGIIEQEDRRLIYADATELDKKNMNFSSLLRTMRSETYKGHPRQFCLIDACMNLVTQLGWEYSMPDERFATGLPEPKRDQKTLIAASPGERAVNLDALQTGLFSHIIQDQLNALPADNWPLDMDLLRDEVTERFQCLRDNGHTHQFPDSVWYLSRSDEAALIFASNSSRKRGDAAAVGAQLLTFVEYRKLITILNGARAPKRLRVLYREATRDVESLGPPRRPDDLISTIDALRRPLSALPLFRFLIFFAADSNAVTQDRMWKWIVKTAPSWDVDINELHTLKMELGRCFILIKLEPDLLGDGMLMTAWRYIGKEGRKCLARDAPIGFEGLSIEVSRLLQEVDPERDPVMPIIEFLVPLSMMEDKFDELIARINDREWNIGTTFPVVVRSLDRPTDDEARKSWRESWDDSLPAVGLTTRMPSAGSNTPTWRAPFDPAALQARVCTAIAYARSWTIDKDPVLQASLAAGIPVALWHRPSSDRHRHRDALEEILRSRALQNLPDVVLSQRSSAKHADAAQDHAGRDLVLLWDDPYRVPRELELHPPAQDGVTK